MTLQNGLLLDDRVMLWSDTLFITKETLRPIGYGAKMFSMPLFPAVITLTTIGGDPHQIPREVGSGICLSLASLLDDCVKSAREFVKPSPSEHLVRILVGAWCEDTQAARLFAICSDRTPNAAPFEPCEMSDWISSGNHTEEYRSARAAGFTPENMMDVIEAQRAAPFVTDCGLSVEPFGAIGGHLMRAEVSREGVKAECLRHWNGPQVLRTAFEPVEPQPVNFVPLGVAA